MSIYTYVRVCISIYIYTHIVGRYLVNGHIIVEVWQHSNPSKWGELPEKVIIFFPVLLLTSPWRCLLTVSFTGDCMRVPPPISIEKNYSTVTEYWNPWTMGDPPQPFLSRWKRHFEAAHPDFDGLKIARSSTVVNGWWYPYFCCEPFQFCPDCNVHGSTPMSME